MTWKRQGDYLTSLRWIASAGEKMAKVSMILVALSPQVPLQIPRHWLPGGGAYGADLIVRTGEKGVAFEFPAHTTD